SGFWVDAVVEPFFELPLLPPVPVMRTTTRASARTADDTPPPMARDFQRLASSAAGVLPPLAATSRSLTVPARNSVTCSSCIVPSATGLASLTQRSRDGSAAPPCFHWPTVVFTPYHCHAPRSSVGGASAA